MIISEGRKKTSACCHADVVDFTRLGHQTLSRNAEASGFRERRGLGLCG